MSGITQLYGFARSASAPVGQQAYTTAGTYTWVAPAGVTSVSVVAVGGGGGGYHCVSCGCWIGGDGGSLAYKNNYAVTPGSSYTVKVGAGAVGGTFSAGGDSCFSSATVVKANGGFYNSTGIPSGGWVGTGGSRGGAGGYGFSGSLYVGGGGGAGYGGNNTSPFTAGKGGIGANSQGNANVCGGGGGGGTFSGAFSGGGVGILGQGTSGAASNTYGNGGSGGANGATTGGLYGGGGSVGVASCAKSGGGGAVRIIWGSGRAFPSTCTADK